MEAIGVGDETLLVGYDDEGGHFVSRVWLVLAAYGHADQVRILEGGIIKWQAEGRPLSTAPPGPRAATFTPREPVAEGAPQRYTRHLVTAEEVNRARTQPGPPIVDLRRRTAVTREGPSPRRGGRIPAAIHNCRQ